MITLIDLENAATMAFWLEPSLSCDEIVNNAIEMVGGKNKVSENQIKVLDEFAKTLKG